MKTNIHFWLYLAQFFLEWEMFLDKICRQTRNTHLVFNNIFFENHAVYEIMLQNIVELYRPQLAIWRMRIACWIIMATNTHWEYVMLIASTLQQGLYGDAPQCLRYTNIVLLSDTTKECQFCYTDYCSKCPPPFCVHSSAYLTRDFVVFLIISIIFLHAVGRHHESLQEFSCLRFLPKTHNKYE